MTELTLLLGEDIVTDYQVNLEESYGVAQATLVASLRMKAHRSKPSFSIWNSPFLWSSVWGEPSLWTVRTVHREPSHLRREARDWNGLK